MALARRFFLLRRFLLLRGFDGFDGSSVNPRTRHVDSNRLI